MGETDAESRNVAGVFDVARRGYDRRQVDDHLTHLLVQLSEAERARRREESRANRAEAELTDLRERLRTPEHPVTERFAVSGGDEDGGRDPVQAHQGSVYQGSAHEGFGLRVEKLLRAAEQEAAETRESAAREATVLLEEARADAEAHRREVEQSLTARDAEIDKKAVRRTVELDERERQVADQGTVARDEADRLLAEARVRAERIETEARMQAAQLRVETEKAAEERRTSVDDEVTRLRTVRRGVRGDLARMLATLASELERPDVEIVGDGDATERVTERVTDRAATAATRDGAPDPADADWFEGTGTAERSAPAYPAAGR